MSVARRAHRLALGITVAAALSACAGHRPTPARTPTFDRRATPDTSTFVMEYPAFLRAALREGTATVDVTVWECGNESCAHAFSRRASHPLFGSALTASAERARFQHALRNGEPAQERLTIHARFTLPATADDALAAPVFFEWQRLGASEWSARFGWPRGDTTAFPVSPGVNHDMTRAVITRLVAELTPADSLVPTRFLCLAAYGSNEPADFGATEPTAPLLASLSTRRVVVVPLRRCPPTLARRRGPRARPIEGAVVGEDPWRVQVGRVRPFARDVAMVTVDIAHGTGGRREICRGDRDASWPGGWRLQCTIAHSWLH